MSTVIWSTSASSAHYLRPDSGRRAMIWSSIPVPIALRFRGRLCRRASPTFREPPGSRRPRRPRAASVDGNRESSSGSVTVAARRFRLRVDARRPGRTRSASKPVTTTSAVQAVMARIRRRSVPENTVVARNGVITASSLDVVGLGGALLLLQLGQLPIELIDQEVDIRHRSLSSRCFGGDVDDRAAVEVAVGGDRRNSLKPLRHQVCLHGLGVDDAHQDVDDDGRGRRFACTGSAKRPGSPDRPSQTRAEPGGSAAPPTRWRGKSVVTTQRPSRR